MSRRKHSDDIPYSFVSLTSQLQHPSLEIDLKRITQNSTPSKKLKKNKSASSSHSHFSSSARSDSNYNESDTSSILRPISVETITPPISKNWKNSSNSNTWEETPIKHVRATPSPMEKLSLSKKDITKNDFNKAQNLQAVNDSRISNDNNDATKREINIIEEEEEEKESSEDAIDIDISEETDEKSLNFLDTLINKMKKKTQNAKSTSTDSLNLQPPLSPLTATKEDIKNASSSKNKIKSKELSPQSAHNSSQQLLQEQVEDQSNKKTTSLKNKCYQLDKYLEEKGYNDTENESDHPLVNNNSRTSNNNDNNNSRNINRNNRYNNNNNNNNDFEFLRKDSTNHKNYAVEKDNFQICDVRECDYEFEPPYPLNMQHFLIFNVDDQHKSKSKNKANNNYSIPPSSNSKISTPTQSRYTNTEKSLITRDKNEDSCSIPFSNSSSGSQFSSPSRHGQSPNSPRLSPRLQKMKENSSSRGTSPDAKMLRDKAIGNTYLSTKDQSIWCQLEEYNEEEENYDFDVEFEPNKEARSQRQTAPLTTRIIRSRVEPEDTEVRGNTYNRNAGRFNTYVDNDNQNERRNRANNERVYKSEIRERNTNSFSPSRRIESNKNINQRNNLFPNRPEINDSENGSLLQTPDRQKKKVIYAEHFTQTEDISNEDELLM